MEFQNGAASQATAEDDPMPSQQSAASNPSPRRLRSKGMDSFSSQEGSVDADGQKKRVTPMRKAKGRIGSLKEDSTATESDDDESLDDAAGDEVDELDSSPSPMGSPEPRQNRLRDQRTPLKRRLRSRKLQTHTPPSDGDDEEEEEDDADQDGDQAGDEAEEDESEDTASVEGGEEEEEEEELVEPRKLRNGKIVGEDAVEEEEEDEDEEEGEEGEEESVNSGSEIEVDLASDAEDAEEDVEGDEEMADEDHDEEMEEGTSIYLPINLIHLN